MNVSTFIPMLLLGLSGTGHCIGMCGPLIIAFPGRSGEITSHLCYHAGRIVTYTSVGVLMGGIGLIMAKIASVTGFDSLTMAASIQVVFSLLAGIFLFLLGLVQLRILPEPEWLFRVNPEKIPGYPYLIRTVFRKNNPLLMGFIGMMMGFLPCGLSFAAFSRALATHQPLEGGILLFVFGIGTLPGLLLIGTGASVLSRRYRRHFDIFSGMLMIVMAISLIVDAIATVI